ncbi:hypothetical protein PIB30_017747 [Stylosanthes scabra]|uniref:Uncharacterized protein n=1 Tax=Stylosanthes scabra TaxID=79078 RepID=A0ABU6S7W9_9FABA|nr:hypothetical protein [Stylosanthes scabra]
MVLPRVLIVSRRTIRNHNSLILIAPHLMKLNPQINELRITIFMNQLRINDEQGISLDLIVRYGAVPVIIPRLSGLHTLLESFHPIHGLLLCEGQDVDPSNYDATTSFTTIDKEKDSIELSLAKPFFGINRGAQILNVSCGGTLYQDVEKDTPLHDWFEYCLDDKKIEIKV